jgi:hypothetical protein
MIGWMMLAAAQAAVLACPGTYRGSALDSVTLFDGPLADNAVLAPERSRQGRDGLTQDWDVAGVHRAGRTLHLRCSYRGGATVSRASAAPLRACRALWTKAGGRFSCR